MEYGVITASFFLVSALAVALQVFFFSPITPDPLQLPPEPSSHLFTPNNHLQGVVKLGEGILNKPEGLSVDQKGMLYTATRDGWIKRLHTTNGTWENWKKIHNRHTLLGLTVTRAGDLIVCDSDDGLIKVSEDGAVTALATHMNGENIRFADDVVEAGDGSLYFSVASTKFGLHDAHLDMLEAKPHGQLLKYDPFTMETSLVLDGLGLANGVAISLDQEFLVVCETWKFRCLKYWLEEIRGKADIFIDNLPGLPDNINLAPDGSFWIAILQLTSSRMKFVHSSRAIKHLLATFPKLYEQVNALDKSAMAINVGSDGKIIKRLDDPTGEVMGFVTSALEFNGKLYFGSLKNDFVGMLPI